MDEFIKIFIQAIGVLLMAFVTYVAVPAIKDWRTTRLDEKQREELTFWVETGVLWAKQWMQTSTGEEKKAEVMKFVLNKVQELKLPFTEEDIDKAIEACYNGVKDVINAATGKDSLTESSGASDDND